MSWDVRMWDRAYVGEHLNYTWNVAAMINEVGGLRLRDLSGLPGEEAAPRLRAAIAAMEAAPDACRALEPENGWGSYEGALAFLRGIVRICEEHPESTLEIA